MRCQLTPKPNFLCTVLSLLFNSHCCPKVHPQFYIAIADHSPTANSSSQCCQFLAIVKFDPTRVSNIGNTVN